MEKHLEFSAACQQRDYCYFNVNDAKMFIKESKNLIKKINSLTFEGIIKR